ncbi:MAG TPA: flavin reductase family protein [Actinomycetota bacterium]|nr:flavin reductase family protein [Candidatus Nanopelagicales bacterium]HPE11265.1 flavin reductase family protein [Actinomycetota bacterium]HPQ84408.1 flavin reductase family protein [Actinomycetota bacterium]HRV67191.1 flavin reductase family protein [Candidatus Nanopelagicales bacterium]
MDDSMLDRTARFRSLMARCATGVVVVTTVVDGFDHAMTANSFTSVSLDPEMVLFCVQKDSRFHEAISVAPRWTVNLLAADQADAARWFAERGRPLERQMQVVEHTRDEDGIPALDGSLGYLSCTTEAIYPGGDHSIVVGRVDRIVQGDHAAEALVFFERRLTGL